MSSAKLKEREEVERTVTVSVAGEDASRAGAAGPERPGGRPGRPWSGGVYRDRYRLMRNGL